MIRGTWVVLVLLVGALAAGCQSTQSKSAELKSKAKDLDEGKGVTVAHQNPDVKVLSTQTLKDKNGEAVVVRMRNVSKRSLSKLPVSVKLADKRGKAVYTNTTPGLETALAHVALLSPGQELFWVNDQVTSTARPAQAQTLVGSAKPVKGSVPRLEVKGVHVEKDPVSGVSVAGTVVNHSKLLQRRVPVFCVARKGNAVVAAGRAILEKVKPGSSASFTIFFIGDPRGARLTVAATPTVLGGATS